MEIRILLDITDKLDIALRRLARSVLARGAVFAMDGSAKKQDVPAEDAPKDESARTDDGEKESEAQAPKAEPKKRTRARKAAVAPAAEISTPAAIADGGKDGDGIAESAPAPEPEAAPAPEPEAAPTQAQETAPQENEDELGKGAVGEIISELTGRLINRMNEEARDKATINRNLRAKCEELQLKFPTVPALIQAIGYGNAYKACIGEG